MNREEDAMTTLLDRPETAVLVIDVQNDVVAGAYNRDGVIANIESVVDKARAANVPVVWVQHSSIGGTTPLPGGTRKRSTPIHSSSDDASAPLS
jgi:nicotinamidase-related amidase